ncbi:MAG: extracellular solute-binding protein [Nibricoccus sp.]
MKTHLTKYTEIIQFCTHSIAVIGLKLPVALFLSGFLVAVPLLLSGCAKKTDTLTVLIWSDYISPQVISRFEKQEGCIVRIETFSSNEELKKKLPDMLDVDVIVPSSYELEGLKNKDLLSKLDQSKITNSRYVDQDFIRKFGLHQWSDVSVPYFVAPTGLAFRDPAKLDARLLSKSDSGVTTLSYQIFDSLATDQGNAARYFTLLNDKREAIAAALLAARQDLRLVDADALKQAKETLLRWCKAGLRFDGKAYQYHLLNDRNLFGQAYMGDVMPLQPKLTFAIPEEGFVITCDCLAILNTSRNRDLAHRFIDFLCAPTNCADNMRWSLYRAPNNEAFKKLTDLEKEYPLLGFLEASWAKNGQILLPLSKEEEVMYDQIWKEFDQYMED